MLQIGHCALDAPRVLLSGTHDNSGSFAKFAAIRRRLIERNWPLVSDPYRMYETVLSSQIRVAKAGASSMSEATVRLLEIEHEMNNLAQQLKQRDQPDKWDNNDIDTRMGQLVDEASKFKSRTIEQIILKARIADAYNFHDPNAELDTDLAESTVRDLIRLGPELTPV